MQNKEMKMVWIIFLIISLLSCSGERQNNKIDHINFNPIKLEEVLRISEFSNDDFFGYISGITLGSDGTIFAADPTVSKIYMFDNHGAYKGFLGGYGAGPGEFRRISSMSLLTPDTLQVVDITLARITLYSISDQSWSKAESFDLPIGTDINLDFATFSFKQFHSFEKGYISSFESTITALSSDNFIKECFVLYRDDFQPIKNSASLCFNKLELITYKNITSSTETVSAMPIPEGYQTLTTVAPGGAIVSIWTEEPILSLHYPTYSDSTIFEFHSVRVPITDKQKRELAKKAVPDDESSVFSRDQITKSIPSYKGFAQQLIVDDENQIWILTNSNEKVPEWMIYDFSGNILGNVPHPGGTFMKIRENKIYVANNLEMEGPAFSVFRIVK